MLMCFQLYLPSFAKAALRWQCAQNQAHEEMVCLVWKTLKDLLSVLILTPSKAFGVSLNTNCAARLQNSLEKPESESAEAVIGAD